MKTSSKSSSGSTSSTVLTEPRADERMLTEKELARRWGCSIKALQKARYAGNSIPFRKLLGTMVRYAISDIEQHERDAQRLSTSDEGHGA